MKYLFILLCVLCNTLNVLAQNIPTVPCSFCGGRGAFVTMAGMSTCMLCNGTGRMVDPNYANQRAAEQGRIDGERIRRQAQERHNNNGLLQTAEALREWANGNIVTAYTKMKRASTILNYAEAYAYFGLMNEIGVNCSANRTYAKQLYQKGKNLGSKGCIIALDRISRHGFLAANSTTRNNARRGAIANCNNIDQLASMTTIPSFDFSPSTSSYSGSSSSHSNYVDVRVYPPDMTGYGPKKFRCPTCGEVSFEHVHVKKRY